MTDFEADRGWFDRAAFRPAPARRHLGELHLLRYPNGFVLVDGFGEVVRATRRQGQLWEVRLCQGSWLDSLGPIRLLRGKRRVRRFLDELQRAVD